MAEHNAALRELLERSQIVGSIGSDAWACITRTFRGEALDAWSDALASLVSQGLGSAAVTAFVVKSPICADAVGPESAILLAPALLDVWRAAGTAASEAFLDAAPIAARRLADEKAFKDWLNLIAEVAAMAPETVELMLERSDTLLVRVDVKALRGWALNGIRSTAGDARKRAAYFSLTDADALRAFEQAASDIVFADVERRLKAYLMALWQVRPLVTTASIVPGRPAPRRITFDGRFVRIPEAYSGFHGHHAERLFRAALTHVAAHMIYTREKLPLGSLKPVQIAIASLIEDARVEALAMRDYPGLRRLWLPFHVAEPHGPHLAEMLMTRLSRALIDPDYKDEDPWVNKGKLMFFSHRAQWDSPAISRTIGSLLGNDIGQMRVQFNAKTYIVEPPYRDDNLGLWDFGEPPPQESDRAETILDAVRISQTESPQDPHHRQRSLEDIEQASQAAQMRAVDEDTGIPIAKQPEWDHVAGRELADWTTILEFECRKAPAAILDGVLDEYADVEQRITKLIRSARVGRASRLRRQPEGERLDLEACIRAAIELRNGIMPDPRVYETSEMRFRDLSVLVLLDVSESTKDLIKGTTRNVLTVERAATTLLAHALSGLGDPFALHAFCSNGRDEVRYYRIKDFGQPYGNDARSRLAGLRGGLSTRIGAALRQGAMEIMPQETHRKLILVVTDGEPSDIDVSDRSYLVEDARKAVQGLAHKAINVFCVGLGAGGEKYLPRIFGRRNFMQIDNVEALPEKLPMLYFRLTA
jgi:nitric oxide reductase NorD protein